MGNNLNLPPPDWVLPPAASCVPVSLPVQRWRWLSRNSPCPEAPPSGEEWWCSSHPAEPLMRHTPPSGRHARLSGVPETPPLSLSPPSACHTHASSPPQPDLIGQHMHRISDRHYTDTDSYFWAVMKRLLVNFTLSELVCYKREVCTHTRPLH